MDNVRDLKGGAMPEAQFRRRGPRAGVATEEAEADESCDQIPFYYLKPCFYFE